jgi:hypothetical protein
LTELLFWVIWYVVDLVFSLGLDLAFDAGSRSTPRKEVGHAEVAWAGVVAAAVGFFTGCVLPERLLPRGPFPGVSVLAAPVLLGASMHLWGKYRRDHDRGPSRLATWNAVQSLASVWRWGV